MNSEQQAGERSTGMGRKVAGAIVRARHLIVVAWLAGAALAWVLLPTIEEAQSGALGDLAPADSPALESEERAQALFEIPLFSRTMVVIREPEGLATTQRQAALRVLAALNLSSDPPFASVVGALPLLNDLSLLRAPERGTGLLAYLFIAPSVGQAGRTSLAELVADRLATATSAEVRVTGAVPARVARGETIVDHLPLVEVVTVVLVAVALGAYFRSPGAPLLNLVAVAVAYATSIRLMAALGELVGISVPREVEPVVVALLLGIVTDYHLFILTRFRTLLADGHGRGSAATTANAELIPVVVTAGSIIAMASLALVTADIGFVRAFGPGMAVAALVAVAVTLTFIPAVLALFGGAVLWPSAIRAAPATGTRLGLSRRGVALAARRPTAVMLVSAAALLACSSGVLGMKLGYPLLRGLPAEAEAKRGYREVVRAFGPGAVAPTLALLEIRGVEGQPRRLGALTRALARTRGVQAAIGPQSLPAAASRLTLDEDGDAARLVFLLRHDPFSDAGLADLRRLRRVAPGLLRAVGFERARLSFAGDTAITAETVGRTAEALLDVAPLSLLVVALLLAVLLRALIAPLYIVAMNLLAVLAALGLTVIFFQGILDVPDLSFFVPFAAAVLLLALGSDYSVFIVSRVWSAARHRPLGDAVTKAGGEAAAAITTAGMILAASFAALALIPLQSFQQLAFAMTAGLLLDAFVVRGLLLPAVIVRIGPAGAWPGQLSLRGSKGPTSA